MTASADEKVWHGQLLQLFGHEQLRLLRSADVALSETSAPAIFDCKRRLHKATARIATNSKIS